MQCKIRVTYQNDRGIDPDIDDRIVMLMERIGAKWYAEGFRMVRKERDICFELEVEPGHNNSPRKHIIKEGSRSHVVSWDSTGRHCSNPECEINMEEEDDRRD